MMQNFILVNSLREQLSLREVVPEFQYEISHCIRGNFTEVGSDKPLTISICGSDALEKSKKILKLLFNEEPPKSLDQILEE